MQRPTVSMLTCLPSPDIIPGPWFSTLKKLKWGNWPNLGFIDTYGHDVARNRNKLAEQALNSSSEWFLWLDSDQTIPAGGLWRLLSWDKPMVAACVFLKGEESTNLPVFYKKSRIVEKEGLYEYCFNAVLRYHYKYAGIPVVESDGAILPAQGALLELDACGFGCVLTHRSVFEKVEPPWFRWHKSGEDFYFCRLAQGAGIQIYGDMGCVVGHKQMGTVTHLSFLNKYAHHIERELRGEIPEGNLEDLKMFAPKQGEKTNWLTMMEQED